jgi:hypothetical protein
MFGTEELGPDELNRSAETGPLIRLASIMPRAQSDGSVTCGAGAERRSGAGATAGAAMGATSNAIDGNTEKGGAVAGELIGAPPHNDQGRILRIRGRAAAVLAARADVKNSSSD